MPGLTITRRSKRAAGFSLVDVVIALAVLAIGVLGVISLLLMLKTRNEAQSAGRHALRACQETMELVLADMKLYSRNDMGRWMSKWNTEIQVFQPKKVVILDKDLPDSPAIAAANPNGFGGEETNCGRIRIQDVSDPEQPRSMYEISVWVDTTGLTTPPIKTRLVTRRSPVNEP